jgi:predicted hotdog family 3-hydroxylacyl-ACP dehydratase
MPIAPRNILELIPQAVPFVMVDELIGQDEHTSTSIFTVTADNCLVDNGLFSEAGLLENIAQTAAARAGYKAIADGKPVAGGYIGAVKDFEVFFLPPVGSQLHTVIHIENQIFNVTVITGSVWCNKELTARCEMKVFLNQNDH